MKTLAALFLSVALLALGGCGQPPREPLALGDRAATQEAFIATVRALYLPRTRKGELSEPIIDANQVRFIFKYHKLWFGRHAEHMRLDFIDAAAGDGKGASYQVIAVYPKQGSDADAPEVRQKILDGMASRLAASKP